MIYSSECDNLVIRNDISHSQSEMTRAGSPDRPRGIFESRHFRQPVVRRAGHGHVADHGDKAHCRARSAMGDKTLPSHDATAFDHRGWAELPRILGARPPEN